MSNDIKVKNFCWKKRINYFFLSMIVIVLTLVIYEFLWGKLFVFSPIYPGFSKHELSNTVIYVQDDTQFNDFNKINLLTSEVEDFFNLKFLKKPNIFIFRDKESYLQRSLTKARFCAFYDNSLVIAPWSLKEASVGKISLKIYLTHELSHILLMQQMGPLEAWQYPKWLLEGIAVYSSDQMGTSFYPSKDETYHLIHLGNFMPPKYFKTSKEDSVKLNVKYRITFMYSEFSCIVDYLIKQYGKNKLMKFNRGLLQGNDQDKLFKQIYGIEFDQFITDFKKYVNEKDQINK